jgi:hypothetical protein
MEKIFGEARLVEQEMGLSTLFLAFGFLEWCDSDSSDKRAFAPLLLLPVQIERQKVQGKLAYSLTREGNAEANLRHKCGYFLGSPVVPRPTASSHERT